MDRKHEENSLSFGGIRPEIESVACSPAAEKARRALAGAERVVIVTKCRYMGDTLVATPFFGQLRRHLPNAHITLLTAPSAAAALAHCPHLDRILPLEMRGVARWRYSREVHTLLRNEKYQAAFLVDRSLRCAALCALAGVPVRIGYVNEHRRPFLTVPIPYTFDRNEVDCHLDMLRAIGLTAYDALPDLWISDEEHERARAILEEQGWSGETPLIGIQPGANDPHIREWGAERYARVADTLIEETGGRVVIMGGAAEQNTAARMERAMRHSAINLTGTLKLREALAVIGQCRLWLGNDTGLLHAAVSQRIPSVGLFGPNKVVRWGYDTPHHRSLVVFPEQPAQDDATVRLCLDAIPEETVLETSRSVLSQPATTATETGAFARVASPVLEKPPYYAARLAPAMLFTARRR